MRKEVTVLLLGVALTAGCKKGGGSTYTHDEPHFTVQNVPGDLKIGTDHVGTNTTDLSMVNQAGNRELFFVWAPRDSEYDPVGVFPTYGKEPDTTKIVEQGEAGTGKYIIHERGAVTYIHKVITTGNQKWGVLCMASTPDPKKDADLIAACKSLELN